MSDDRRSRPTSPPSPLGRGSTAHGEDPPPNTPPPERKPPRPRMPSIGRLALNAPPVTEQTAEERVLQALKQTEEQRHREVEAAEERARHFEESLRSQIQSIVTKEVKHSVPPPPPEKSTWAHIGPQLPAIIAAIGAIVMGVAQSCAQAREIVPRLDKLEERITADETNDAAARAADKKAQNAYDFKARYWTQDVLEQLDVKIDDPLGAPDRKPDERLKFYPPPKLDPHKIQNGTAAPRVQPMVPFPLPPPALPPVPTESK